MENEFIPYKEAFALKKLGFDEPCLAFYSEHGILTSDLSFGYYSYESPLYIQEHMENPKECTAPTFSQVFRWFRERYFYNHTIQYNVNYVGIAHLTVGVFNTYEEAELGCLRNLIKELKPKEITK